MFITKNFLIRKNLGYSGIFMLLIGATLFILLISQIYFKKAKKEDPRSEIQKRIEVVDEAKNIKNMLEERDREMGAEAR